MLTGSCVSDKAQGKIRLHWSRGGKIVSLHHKKSEKWKNSAGKYSKAATYNYFGDVLLVSWLFLISMDESHINYYFSLL